MVNTDVLSLLWTDTVTVTVRESYKKSNRATAFREKTLYEDIPCKLSFFNSQMSKDPVENNQVVSAENQLIKLFLSPSYNIPPGSKISVTHKGTTTDYTHSSVPAVYTNHQELVLELFERWA